MKVILDALQSCSACGKKTTQPKLREFPVYEKDPKYLVVYSGGLDDFSVDWLAALTKLGMSPSVWIPTVWCGWSTKTLSKPVVANCRSRLFLPMREAYESTLRGMVVIGRLAISHVLGRGGGAPQAAHLNGRVVRMFEYPWPILLLLDYPVFRELDPASASLRNTKSDVKKRIEGFVADTR